MNPFQQAQQLAADLPKIQRKTTKRQMQKIIISLLLDGLRKSKISKVTGGVSSQKRIGSIE